MARHTEDDQQIAVVNWFRTAQQYKQIPQHYLLVHSNNSTQNLDTFAKRRNWGKRGGVAGLPDLVLYASNRAWHGIFIEMKAEIYKPKRLPSLECWWLNIKPTSDGKEITSHGVTSTQSAVMNKLQEAGYCCVVCFSANDAIKSIQMYLGLEF